MKIITARKKDPETENLQCPICECTFSIQIPDLYDIEYTSKGKMGYVNCPDCKAKLKVYENKCVNPCFKLWFSVPELIPKHIL